MSREERSSKLKFILNSITVEPVAFCYMFPAHILFMATQNFNLEKACRVNLKYNSSICDAILTRNKTGYNVTDEQSVQALVASVNSYSTGLQGFLVCFSLLIIGSWSDKNNKRKPLLILPLIGDIVTAILLLVSLVFYNELPVEYNAFAEAIPQGLAGGWYSLMTAAFAYISEDPNINRRAIRIGAINVAMLLAIYSGFALGGYLFNIIELYQVYLVVIGIHLLGIVYTYLKVKEVERDEEQLEKSSRNIILDAFNLNHVKRTFKFLFIGGSTTRRTKIWLILIAMWGVYGLWQGEKVVMYLYVRYKFGWNEVDHSVYMVYTFVISVLGIPFWLTICTKVLKMDHSAMGILATTAKIISTFIYAFAPNTLVFYLGMIIEMTNGMANIALRTILSKLVAAEEQGKLTALTEVANVTAMFVYGSLYSMVYRVTIQIFPGSFYFLSGIITLFPLGMFLWLYRDYKQSKECLEVEQMTQFLGETVANNKVI